MWGKTMKDFEMDERSYWVPVKEFLSNLSLPFIALSYFKDL